jgi:hypothetical protein
MNVMLLGQKQAYKQVTFSVSLPIDGWSDNSLTIINSLFQFGYSYIISPTVETSDVYYDSIIQAKNISIPGKLTFICKTIPAEIVEV